MKVTHKNQCSILSKELRISDITDESATSKVQIERHVRRALDYSPLGLCLFHSH